jgi:hypothetical protein
MLLLVRPPRALFLLSPDPNAFFKTLCFFCSQQKSPARKLAAAVFSSLFLLLGLLELNRSAAAAGVYCYAGAA